MSYIPRYPLEIGFQVGSSLFLGDLGGTRNLGAGAFIDANPAAIRPTVGIFGRYNMGGRFSFRLEANYILLAGDDKLTGSGFSSTQISSSPGWYRYYRNLHFQAHVFEMANSVEFSIHNFKLTTNRFSKVKHNVLSPYVVLGTGFLVFVPQANYNGKWVDLHPLRTEGQGLIEGKKPYSLIQFIIPVGFGLRWEHDHSYVFSFEINHRFTFTDYLDDVSTEYVDPAIFQKHFDPAKAKMATDLARRSSEQDPSNKYGYISAPNQKRGDPQNNDSYFTFNFRIAFYLKRSRPISLVKDY